MNYSCTVRHTDGCATLTVGGDMDLAAHEQFLTDAEPWTGTAQQLVIDCSDVSFMDSMGLQALVRLRTQTADAGHEFFLASPSTPVLRVLELAGLTTLFNQQDLASPTH